LESKRDAHLSGANSQTVKASASIPVTNNKNGSGPSNGSKTSSSSSMLSTSQIVSTLSDEDSNSELSTSGYSSTVERNVSATETSDSSPEKNPLFTSTPNNSLLSVVYFLFF
jgi:hypothetical protein